MSIDQNFSEDLKGLIKRSREVAMELGYNYISSIHFLIADCESNYPASLNSFAFPAADQFEQFKQEYRLSEPYIVADLIPLTKEAERIFKKINKIRRRAGDALCFPHHFFLSAFSNKSNGVCQLFEDADLFEKVVQFYTAKNVLGKPWHKKNIWQWG